MKKYEKTIVETVVVKKTEEQKKKDEEEGTVGKLTLVGNTWVVLKQRALDNHDFLVELAKSRIKDRP